MPTRDVIERFEIMLEHDIDEQYQYEPGEVLRGNILLVLNDSIKVKAIQVSGTHHTEATLGHTTVDVGLCPMI